jgi:hypothetical protein
MLEQDNLERAWVFSLFTLILIFLIGAAWVTP